VLDTSADQLRRLADEMCIETDERRCALPPFVAHSRMPFRNGAAGSAILVVFPAPLTHCEQHYSGDMPPESPAGLDTSSSGGISAVLESGRGIGEVDVDIVHGGGLAQCRISLGQTTLDGGAAQCLVRGPERPQRSPMTKSVMSW